MKKWIWTIFILLQGGALAAQTVYVDNVINYKKQTWKFVSTTSFDIYYQADDPQLAENAAKYAEAALFDVSTLLDYAPKEKYALFIFPDPESYVHSNVFPNKTVSEQGMVQLLNNVKPIVYPGSAIGFEKEIRTAITALLLEEFYYGGGIQLSIQKNVLIHTPEWFNEGFTRYMGEGWSFEDEMWISSLSNQNLLAYALEGNGKINQVVRKSVWHYVVHHYGERKLSEIFYMTRLTRSAEAGVITVLGITLKTLTERWREFLLTGISGYDNGRDLFLENANALDYTSKDRILSFDLHPEGDKAAVYVLRDGRFRVNILDISSGKMTETDIKAGARTDQYDAMDFAPPIAWSKDGEKLITTISRKGKKQFAILDVGSGVSKYAGFPRGMGRVMQLAWSHEGDQIVGSALNNGSANLFIMKPGGGGLSWITEDGWDNLHPIFSLDDQTLFFASNRPSDTLAPDQIDYSSYQNALDLFKVNVNGPEYLIEQITSTPGENEVPLSVPSSFELIYSSDESGINNLYKTNVFLGNPVALTNVNQGFHQVSISNDFILFDTPIRGKHQLFHAKRSDYLGEHYPEPTPMRLELQKEMLREQALQFDFGFKDLPETKDNDPPEKRLEEEVEEEKDDEPTLMVFDEAEEEYGEEETLSAPDSTNSEEPQFYVFDEEEDTDFRTRVRQRRLEKQKKKFGLAKEQSLDFDSIEVSTPKRAKTRWATEFINNQITFSPPFFGRRYRTRMALLFSLGFRDIMGNHRFSITFQPYMFDFKSADLGFKYEYLRHRVDFFGEANAYTRLMVTPDFFLRYSVVDMKVGAKWPINRYSAVSGFARNTYILRTDLFPLDEEELDGADVVPGIGASYTYDRVRRFGSNPWKGFSFSTNLETNYSTDRKSLNFTTAKFDARGYLPVLGKFVLAGRFSGGLSVGPNRQRFFLGGVDNWFLSSIQNGSELPFKEDVADYHFSEFVTPMHGFRYNARNGTQFALLNVEFRMPVTRMVSKGLNSNPIYNFEIIPFFDIGTIWEEGNPLSQKNPINNDPIIGQSLVINVQTLKSPFVMSFGSGVRANLFGYSVRADLAWGVDDYTVLRPMLHLSLGKNF